MAVKFRWGDPNQITDQDLIQDYYKKLMAPPPQAAEPMGNSIRRLLNATGFGTPQPMMAFTPPPAEPMAALPQTAKVPTTEEWAENYLKQASTPAAKAFLKNNPEYRNHMPTTWEQLMGRPRT